MGISNYDTVESKYNFHLQGQVGLTSQNYKSELCDTKSF